jgi:hypothetical protein
MRAADNAAIAAPPPSAIGRVALASARLLTASEACADPTHANCSAVKRLAAIFRRFMLVMRLSCDWFFD